MAEVAAPFVEAAFVAEDLEAAAVDIVGDSELSWPADKDNERGPDSAEDTSCDLLAFLSAASEPAAAVVDVVDGVEDMDSAYFVVAADEIGAFGQVLLPHTSQEKAPDCWRSFFWA